MKKLRLRENNTGMTLVELLVAIAIFAAAIVPMLYAFVYSTGFNFKAQQTMQSTGIAQAIIEKCKAANTDYDALITSLTDGSILTDNNNFAVGSVDVSGNTFTLHGVTPKTFAGVSVNDAVDAGNASRRSYDVTVTLSPVGDAISDYSALHPMRSGVTANYLTVDTLRSKDETFQGGFEDLIKQTIRDNVVVNPAPPVASLDAYADKLFDDVFDIRKLELERVITITADNSDVKLKVEYKYVGYDGNAALNLGIWTTAVDGTNRHITCNATPATTLDASTYPAYEMKILDGHPASSVFFYYYPLYKGSNGGDGVSGTNDDTAVYKDHFILNNDMTLDYLGLDDDKSRLDFYLFKQLPLSGTDTFYKDVDVEGLDSEYKPTIELNSSAPFPTNLYHNFLWNVVTGDEIATAFYPVTTVDDIHDCHVRTVVCHRDPNDPYNILPSYLVSDHYKDTFYVTSVTGYEHDSFILEDKAVLPYGSEKNNAAISGRFGARFIITVTVSSATTSQEIETMSSEFLNW